MAPQEFEMAFRDRLQAVITRIAQTHATISTEEATKHALVLPILQVLGYDVFNPHEVYPEYTADVGTKKGEKIDYAIMSAGAPIILIECKAKGAELDMRHASQLFRYFATLQTRLAILTNGLSYQFYSDLERVHVMDSRPFLELNLLDLSDGDIANLDKISKEHFDIDGIVSTASNLMQIKAIKKILSDLFKEPDLEFVKYLACRVTDKNLTKGVLDSFKPLVGQALSAFVNERLNDRLRQAMAPEGAGVLASPAVPPISAAEESSEEDAIVTTQEELMGFFAVKAAIGGLVSLDRIQYRDSKSYCAILLDDNNRKPICRLFFNGKNKSIGLFDNSKSITRFPIVNIDDIFQHSPALRSRVQAMLVGGDAANVDATTAENPGTSPPDPV